MITSSKPRKVKLSKSDFKKTTKDWENVSCEEEHLVAMSVKDKQTGKRWYLKPYLSKLVCAILAMKVASPTTWAILPRASPAAQRRIGLGLSNAPITRARADLRTSSGPRVLLFSANPFSQRHMIHYFWCNLVFTELPSPVLRVK